MAKRDLYPWWEGNEEGRRGLVASLTPEFLVIQNISLHSNFPYQFLQFFLSYFSDGVYACRLNCQASSEDLHCVCM